MKIKTFYSICLQELEEKINVEVDKLMKEDVYIEDIDIKFQRGQYKNEYIGIIKYRPKVGEKIVGQWFDMNKNCLD